MPPQILMPQTGAKESMVDELQIVFASRNPDGSLHCLFSDRSEADLSEEEAEAYISRD